MATSLAYEFAVLPEPGHQRPAFVNLQQYHFEECLVRRAEALAAAEIRWKHRVVGVSAGSERMSACAWRPRMATTS